jgi:hypothetical protein
MLNINPAQAFVVQIVERGSVDDTVEVRRSNEAVMLTCAEYVVFDLRSTSERSRVPSRVVAEEMYEDTMARLGRRIEGYMRANDREALMLILRRLAPNRYTEQIKAFLRNTGVSNERKQTKIEI